MKLISRISDALLGTVAPKATAEAAPCDQCYSECRGISLYKCCRDRCAGTAYKCVYVGPHCA